MLGLLMSLLGQTITYTNPAPKVYAQKVIEIQVEEPVLERVEFKEEQKYNINCFCVSYARQFIKDLPRGNAESFEPNAGLTDGEIVILDYEGLRHIALYEITNEGLLLNEANFKSCSSGKRLLKWNKLSANLIGFYTPKNIMEEEKVVDVVEETEEVETPEVEATEEVEEETTEDEVSE